MAKKGKRTTTKKTDSAKKGAAKEPVVSMRMKIVRIILGLFCVVLCVFTAAALFSYTYTWMADQSLVSDPDAWNVHLQASNICGKIGFFWADFLIAKLFGLGAFLVPIFIAIRSVFCFNVRRVRLIRSFLLTIFGCIILSVLCAYIFDMISLPLFSQGAGGSYGHFASLWLNGMLGPLGAGATIAVFLFIWIVCLTQKVAFWTESLVVTAFAPKPEKEDAGDVEAPEEEDTEDEEEKTSDVQDDTESNED